MPETQDEPIEVTFGDNPPRTLGPEHSMFAMLIEACETLTKRGLIPPGPYVGMRFETFAVWFGTVAENGRTDWTEIDKDTMPPGLFHGNADKPAGGKLIRFPHRGTD